MLSELLYKSSCHKSFDTFLNEGNLLSFFTFIVIVDHLVSLLLLCNLFELLLLEIHGFESSDDTLSASLNLLNDPDSCLHVSVEGCSLLDYLLLREIGLFEIKQELLNNLVPFLFLWGSVVYEIPWDGHLYLCRPHSHLQYEFVQIHVLRPD